MIYQDIINFTNGFADLDSDPNTLTKGFVYRGEVGRVLAGEDIERGDFLYPVRTSLAIVAEWKIADADAIASMPILCMALEDADDAERLKVIFSGYVKNTGWDFGTRATGTITIDGDCAEGDTITIDGIVFECRTDDTLTEGSDYVLDISEAVTKATVQAALTAAITLAIGYSQLDLTQSEWALDVLTLTAGVNSKGYEGNTHTLVKSGTNIAVSGATFSGGVEGGVLYAGLTAGELTLTAPTAAPDVVQYCGCALTAEKIIFRPQFDFAAVSG